MASDNSQAQAGGGVLSRYAILALASAIFFVAIFFLFLTLFKQKDLIERQSRVNIWFLAQTEIEYLNFIEAFDQFALDECRLVREAVVKRCPGGGQDK